MLRGFRSIKNVPNGFSDGKNVYTCFRCDFTLCVGCVKAVGGEDALATVTSAASVTAAFDEGRNNREITKALILKTMEILLLFDRTNRYLQYF